MNLFFLKPLPHLSVTPCGCEGSVNTAVDRLFSANRKPEGNHNKRNKDQPRSRKEKATNHDCVPEVGEKVR